MIDMQGKRARRVVTGRKPRVTGRYPSMKSNRTVQWESQLERDFIMLLEFDPSVCRYREQPKTVEIKVHNGPNFHYTPDFYAERLDGRYVYEVKEARELQKDDIRRRLTLAGELMVSEGYFFQVVTEETIRVQPLLGNIRMLLPLRSVDVPEECLDSAKEYLSQQGATPFHELAPIVAPGAQGWMYLKALISHHKLKAPLDSEDLTADSLISPA
ncbi:TnsA endonuclease N-terminal domain-containing protein [Ferrovibrio sp.]|uniref:TnsA endonuclease N-terminal domain-containing protein n=1 Tax=Ferrovibrio sp. TaxID=1917215 RepID=UPI003D1140DA